MREKDVETGLEIIRKSIVLVSTGSLVGEFLQYTLRKTVHCGVTTPSFLEL